MSTSFDLRRAVERASSKSDLLLAGLVVGIIGLMVLPLPTVLLDVLIAANLSISVTLLSALERAEAAGAREIVVDLRQVPILSSGGVSALLIVANRLGPDRRLILARPCDMVRRVCEVTGLVRFVDLRDQLPPGLETRPEWADSP